MYIYFGIPVNIYEIFRIFGLDLQAVTNCSLVGYVDKYFKMKFTEKNLEQNKKSYIFSKNIEEIQVFKVDYDQYIIGYKINEYTDVFSKFINVDDYIALILELKKRFSEEIKILNGDLSEVTLQNMEDGDQEKVKNPIPYIISYCDR